MKSKFKTEIFEVDRPNLLQIFRPLKRRYCLFPKDNAVTSSLISGDVYEPYLFYFIGDNLIELEGTDIIEIGSNNGNFTVEFADMVGDKGRVFAFEPQRVIFQQLCGNVFMNGFDNVYAFNMALGDEEGVIDMEVPDYYSEDFVNFGDVGISTRDNVKTELTQMKRLDSFEFNSVKIMKIDVQGYEIHVLKGSLSTISRHRPIIFIEVEDHQLKKYGFSEPKLFQFIGELNYTIQRFQKGIPYQTYSGECLDCVCIPNELLSERSFFVR